MAGFEPETSSQSQLEGQRFAGRKLTCPPALCRCMWGDKPPHSWGYCLQLLHSLSVSGASQPSSRSAPPCAPPGASPARALFHPLARSIHHHSLPPPPLPVPSHSACWIPSSLLTPWGKAGRCNQRQQERGRAGGKGEGSQ